MTVPSLWSDERDLVHRDLLHELYAAAGQVPCERRAVLIGGLPGADKSGTDRSAYVSVKLDAIGDLLVERGLLPESPTLTSGESCYLRYLEASHLAEHFAWLAMTEGRNLLWDLVMADPVALQNRIDTLHIAGYSVDRRYADIPVDESSQRVRQAGADQLAALFGDPITFIPGSLDEVYHAFYRGDVTLEELNNAKGFHRWDI